MAQQQGPLCESCGMPMPVAADHGRGDASNPRCKYCTNPDGSYRSYEEVLEGTVQAFMAGMLPGSGKLSREEAERQASYLKSLPAWKK